MTIMIIARIADSALTEVKYKDCIITVKNCIGVIKNELQTVEKELQESSRI